MDDPFCKRCGTLLEPVHCSVCQTTAQEAHLENKITSLEAENDRLREALEGLLKVHIAHHNLPEHAHARAALDQSIPKEMT